MPAPGVRILAEDPLVLMVRFDMEAIDSAEAEARLDIDAVHGDQHGKLTVDGDRALGSHPLPEGRPGSYLHAFVRDIQGEPAEDDLDTRQVLKAARTVLTIQRAADENAHEVPLL